MYINNNTKGIFWIILSAAGFTTLNSSSKLLAEYVNTMQVVFLVFVCGLLVVSPILIIKKCKFDWSVQYLSIMRAALGVISNFMMYYAFSRLPFAHVTILSLTTALFVMMLSIIFLKDKTTYRTVLSLLIGFSGAFIIIKPWDDLTFSFVSIIALVAAMFWAIEDLIAKIASNKGDITLQTFYLSLFFIVYL